MPIKSLFHKNSKSSDSSMAQESLSISYEQLEGMSFDEVFSLLQSLLKLKRNANVHSLISFIRRFYRIALYDNHVLPEHRETALKLAEVLTADVEAALSNSPEAVSALKNANASMVKDAQRMGYGSLAWKVQEYSISDVIAYAMKPEHRHLVPDFLEAMPPEHVAKTKRYYVRELVLQSSYDSRNAVLVLHGLCAKGDPAASVLFTLDEYAALLGVPDDYDAGRGVLVRLGLLPVASGAKPFKRLSDIKYFVAQMLQERKGQSEADPRAMRLPEDRKTALLLTLGLLRIELTRAQVSTIYGEDESNEVLSIYTSPGSQEALARFRQLTQALRKVKAGAPIDLTLLDAVLSLGGTDVAKSEEEFNDNREFLDMALGWLNTERVEFLDYFRLMMRVLSDPSPPIQSAADKHIAAIMCETYLRVGVQASIAEKTMYYEDWIGVGHDDAT